MFAATSKAGLVVLATTDRLHEAQRIVAYPEDFGMNRNQVRRLQRGLVARQAFLHGEATAPVESRRQPVYAVRLQLVETPTAPRQVTPEWCRDAQKIVVYPEDYGMNRQAVRGLEQMLADRLQSVPAPVAPLRRQPRLISGGEEFTRPAA